MRTLEFWPDYGNGPLWDDGEAADPRDLPLPGELAARLIDWNSQYEESKIPVDGEGDPEWVRTGVVLLAQVRAHLEPDVRVVVTEPWWGETPSA